MDYKFKNFDVNADPPKDHYFMKPKSLSDNATTTSIRPNLARAIYKEWSILQTSLPDSILVRAFETRIDLMRAVIVGSEGTPYYNGLFFFDIGFPYNYPNDPPTVVYHPRPGLYMNPNFHSNGLVCLSIINTWPGNQDEAWNPQKSTILQVLVSIQGLVLHENPYLNDPNSVHPFTTIEICRFNRKLFARTHESMLYMLRNPPDQFQYFVAKHFDSQANNILSNFKMRLRSNSMKALFLDLAEAFEVNGSDCREEIDQVKKMDKVRGSIAVKIVDKLMYLLCCDCFFEFLFSPS
ncbi:putative ubiquitin-conjugating enzyme E2 38 [Tripterygium wilfordii]|uniref:putative ubiquitin-conjugating enzyme E2 38 n=1 Tax=Tripterygium wilfordii TaxID=458696 RepID=UPI0018F821E0|nr:putative ubiquitin-conjugating enzyme E2 38 [Tripterygium wilfordii]